MELHHPIMSKLWGFGGRTKRKKRRKMKLNMTHPRTSKFINKKIARYPSFSVVSDPWYDTPMPVNSSTINITRYYTLMAIAAPWDDLYMSASINASTVEVFQGISTLGP